MIWRVILEKIKKRMEVGKAYSIVAVAEGIKIPKSKERPAMFLPEK